MNTWEWVEEKRSWKRKREGTKNKNKENTTGTLVCCLYNTH